MKAARPACFDAQCREAKLRLRTACRLGWASQDPKKEDRRTCQAAERRFSNRRTAWILDRTEAKDPELYDRLQKKIPRQSSPISAQGWEQYLKAHLKGSLCYEKRTEPTSHTQALQPSRTQKQKVFYGRDLAIPLGRRQRVQGEGSSGTGFALPQLPALHTLVTEHVGKMNSGSAAGPDGWAAGFIKGAKTKKEGEPETNCLVPYLERITNGPGALFYARNL